MKKCPRDENNVVSRGFEDGYEIVSTGIFVTIKGTKAIIDDDTLLMPKETFNALVDWYIEADAIRAALKAKDEEIARLRAKLALWREVYVAALRASEPAE